MSPDILINRLTYQEAQQIAELKEADVGYRLYQAVTSYKVYANPNLGHEPSDEKLRSRLLDDARWTVSLTDEDLNRAKSFLSPDSLQRLLK